MTRVRVSAIVRLVFIAAVGALLLPAPALSGPFVLESGVNVNLGCNPLGPYGDAPGRCHDADDPFDIIRWGPDKSFSPGQGAGYVSMSDDTDGVPDPSFIYFAEADASFGRLSAGVTGAFDLSSEDTRLVSANAHVIDLMTVGAPGLAGTEGTLNVTFDLTGSSSTSGLASALALFGVQWGGDEPFDQNEGVFDLYTGPARVRASVPFVYGTPFFLGYFLGVGVGTPLAFNDDGELIFTEVAGVGEGTADFSNTVRMTGLEALDAAGRPVTAEFSGASGTLYTPDGVVPEPATLVLVALGLTGAVARSRRRH